jgi:hypothetical protein
MFRSDIIILQHYKISLNKGLMYVSHVGIIGSRVLPFAWKAEIEQVVAGYVRQGWQVHTGGALGADAYVLAALVRLGAASSGVVHAAWTSLAGFPSSVRPLVAVFLASGGKVIWGTAEGGESFPVVVDALLGRNQRLIASVGRLVAYPHGASRGTHYTIAAARRAGIPVFLGTTDRMAGDAESCSATKR